LSAPPTITSVTFDQAAYAPGSTVTATIGVSPGTVDNQQSYSGTGTDPHGDEGNWAFTFVSQDPDKPVVNVSDSAGGWWTVTMPQPDGSSTATTTLPSGTAGDLTVAVSAAGLASGLTDTYTTTLHITEPAVGTNKGAWAALQTATGPLRAYRGFVPPNVGVPPSWPGNGAAPIPAGNILPIVSLNLDVPQVLAGALDSQLAAYAATVPAGALLSVGAEDEAGRYAYTPVQIRGVHAHCYKIFKRANPGLRYGQVVTTYTSNPASAHYPLATDTDPRWVAGGLDWYGLDVYAFSSTDTAEANINGAIKQMRLAGATGPWVIAETNTSHGNRATWFREVYGYARKIGALAVCSYWGAAPYAWDSSDTDTVTALKQITAQPAAL